jgi:hypothetical protein
MVFVHVHCGLVLGKLCMMLIKMLNLANACGY